MNSFTEENYLKAIYKLTEQTNSEVSTNSIAEKMSTKAATVTDMLKKLSLKKLINYQKYQGVSLTASGKKIALSIVRKHRLWEFFLVEKLNFKWDQVHGIAEELEHIHSNELTEKLDRFLGFPKFDPHGDPIPDVDGKFHNAKSLLLEVAVLNKSYIITGVVDHSSSFLQYLDSTGIVLGKEIKVKERNGYDKSLHAQLSGKKIFISNEVAKNILVSKK